MTSQQYLESVLAKHNLDDGEVERLKTIRQELEKRLKDRYGSKIEKVLYSGSYAKDTAIDLKYDLDLCIYFKQNAFSDLKQMYDDVYDSLSSDFGYKYNVEKQNVSIRLDLKDRRSVDVVPARSLENGTDDAYLYSLKTGHYIKTNIKKHIGYISDSKDRPIIKLAKIWKIEHNIHFKSFALELLVIKALSSCSSDDYGDQFMHVLKFIQDNVTEIKLVDPANSNNNVADAIDYSDKCNLKDCAAESLKKQYWKNILW